jgi:hypothetical protein
VTVYAVGDGHLLRFPLAAEFLVLPGEIRCSPLAGGDPYLMEIYLLGTVLAFWLELRGLPVLHAAAVAVGGGAAVFLGTNQGGKSSLAAAMLQHGAALVSDDLLPVERPGGQWLGRPAYPQMRFWPDQARHFYGEPDSLPHVAPGTEKLRVPVGGGFGEFSGATLPIHAIYLPHRVASPGALDGSRIEAATPQEALVELIRCSFLARMLAACGRQPARLPLLAALAGAVPVRRLVYPSGVEHLPEVAAAVRADLSG